MVEIITRQGHPDFLDLPWGTPLAEWEDARLEPMAHGISRHIVRFVRYDHRVYALKETESKAAFHEYDVLKDLRADHLPVVEPVGVADGSPAPGAAVLITRFLDYSLPYWYVLGQTDSFAADRLIDAGVVLLVRLHLERVFWGDCSLSNILWRRDAGAMMAYLVDAETSERHATLSDQMRIYDVEIATENVVGGLLELQARQRVSESVDPIAIAETLRARYEALWSELTRSDSFDVAERWRIDQRIRNINELGFDVEELSINSDGTTVSITPVLLDEGHHARELRRRTGLDVQENQARRLIADIENYRASVQSAEGTQIPVSVATARWLAEVYEPLIASVADEHYAHLEPAELFHQMLENRYLMSERLGESVSNEAALEDLLGQLGDRAEERQLSIGDDPLEESAP